MRVTEAIRLCGLVDEEWVDEFAMKRGTLVHEAIALDLRGKLDESTVDPVEVAPRLESFRAWKRQSGAEVRHVEIEVENLAMGYGGRIDAVFLLHERTTIIDYKNGLEQSWHPYQLALYQMAWQSDERLGERATFPNRGNLYLSSEGRPAKYVERKDRRDFERAKAIITVANIHKENGR